MIGRVPSVGRDAVLICAGSSESSTRLYRIAARKDGPRSPRCSAVPCAVRSRMAPGFGAVAAVVVSMPVASHSRHCSWLESRSRRRCDAAKPGRVRPIDGRSGRPPEDRCAGRPSLPPSGCTAPRRSPIRRVCRLQRVLRLNGFSPYGVAHSSIFLDGRRQQRRLWERLLGDQMVRIRTLVTAHSDGQDRWRGREGEPWLRWGRAQ